MKFTETTTFNLNLVNKTAFVSNTNLFLWICAFAFFMMSGMARGRDVTDGVMQSLDCHAPGEFYGINLTPLPGLSYSITGYSPIGFAENKQYTVSWCQTDRNRFILFIEKRGKLHQEWCPPYIKWGFPPKGLSLVKNQIPLDEYHFINDYGEFDGKKNAGMPRRVLSKLGHTSAMSIRDGDSSLENDFFCYKGNWMLRSLD